MPPRHEADHPGQKLYALPPEEFLAARQALSTQLRGEGNRAAADAVRALRKPTVVAWAQNQVARAEPDALERLFAAGDRLKEEHAGLLGAGDASGLRAAEAEERARVRELVAQAEKVLAGAGHAASADVVRQLHEGFHAAAVGPAEARLALARGMLAKPLEAELTLESALAPLAAARPPRAPRRPAAAGKGEPAAAAARLQAAEEHARERAAEARRAEREAATARDRAEQAEKVAARARAAADRADAAAEAARVRADTARAELEKLRGGG